MKVKSEFKMNKCIESINNDPDNAEKLIYEWVKTGHINYSEYHYLMYYILTQYVNMFGIDEDED